MTLGSCFKKPPRLLKLWPAGQPKVPTCISESEKKFDARSNKTDPGARHHVDQPGRSHVDHRSIYVGREIFVPIALAVLLSFVLAPFAIKMQSWRIPRTLSVLVVVFLGIFGHLQPRRVDGLPGDTPRRRVARISANAQRQDRQHSRARRRLEHPGAGIVGPQRTQDRTREFQDPAKLPVAATCCGNRSTNRSPSK